jgi:hypothetical protein
MKPRSVWYHRRLLRSRTPEDWQSALRSIRSHETRTICCCIVWFDYFSDEDPPKPSPPILSQARSDWDYWLLTRRRIKTNQRSLETALTRLGYHPDIARKRSLVVSE